MRAWYANLAERERRMVRLGGIAAVVLLLLAIVLPLNRNIAQARQRVTTKQADLAFIQNAVPQLASAGPGIGTAATGESLVVLIDSSARESGLGKSLSSSQPTRGQGAAHPPRSRAVRCTGGLAGAAFAEPRRARGIGGNRIGRRSRVRECRSRPQGGLSHSEAPHPGAHVSRGAAGISRRAGALSTRQLVLGRTAGAGQVLRTRRFHLEWRMPRPGDSRQSSSVMPPGTSRPARRSPAVPAATSAVHGNALDVRADLDLGLNGTR